MKLKDTQTIDGMIGNRLYSIYPDYISGQDREYIGKIKEYVILGVDKTYESQVLLWDIEKQEVKKRYASGIRNKINNCSTRARIWSETYAYAFTKENAEKCLRGLQNSIEADHHRKKRFSDLIKSSFNFTMVPFDGKGLKNLLGVGVKSTHDNGCEDTLYLYNDYKKIMDQGSLCELEVLNRITTGKHIFELSGADEMNRDTLKGKILSERDIFFHVDVIEDTLKRSNPKWNFKIDGTTYSHEARWLSWKIYFKLPQNNWVSIKKFDKFFNIYDLQKIN